MNENKRINLDHPEDVTTVLNSLLDSLPEFELTKKTLLSMYNHIRNYRTKIITEDELRESLKPFFIKDITN